MLPFTEKDIRESFINASLKERNAVVLPQDFAATPWDRLDYFGWADRKAPQLGYVVIELDGAPVGILLRRAEGVTRSRPQCAWCEDVLLPNDVVFYGAKRAGQSGRNGNSIGTLVCAGFECSANVRKRPPVAYIGFDVDAAREQRIEALQQNVRSFARNVRDGR